MQTVEENKINYLVFPSQSIDTSSLDESGNYFILYAYQTMENDDSEFIYQSSSVDTNERWRTVTANIQTTDTPSTELLVKAGTTYEIQLRYGTIESPTWGETEDTWGSVSDTWGRLIKVNTVTLANDTMFVSGSVIPNQKIYVSSNEDATLKIYQG